MDGFLDPNWPPGTVRIELLKNDKKDAEIILQPRPTDNPNDPLNWTRPQKILNYALASFYAMMVFAFINATTPTWGPMGTELNFSDATLTNTYAIGCATLALGAPMLIPFALKYGRRPIYVFSSAAQLAISVWAAKTMTAGDWWGVNALQCWLGALAEVLIQMTVADVFFVHERGLMNSIFIWVMHFGSDLAPVAGGFITDSQGWRWVWWWCAIFFGLDLIAFTFLYEETKFNHHETLEGREALPPTIEPSIDSKSEKIPAVISDPESGFSRRDHKELTAVHINPAIPRKTYLQKLSLTTISPGSFKHFARHSYQPFFILFTIPGVFYMSIVYAVLLAWASAMSTAQSLYMLKPPYNFSSSAIGLMSLAPFIGATIGSAICGPISDWLILRLAKKNDGIYEPEMRIWSFVPFIPFQVAGTFLFGQALGNGMHWAIVAFAAGLTQVGTSPLQIIALTYMTDAYSEIIGDALTALAFVRNTWSTAAVFAMTPWVAAVGMANVFNTIGAIGIAILLFSFAFLWKGKQWRVMTAKTYKYYADRQYDTRPIGR